MLHAVPHDHVADGGSDVNGHASLRLTGRTLDINLSATGLTPGEPHAMHIHGDTQAANECPGIEADANTGDPIDPSSFTAGTPDGLISLAEGLPDYGPIDVSLTVTGDTSASSGLSLERFLKADANGSIQYHRSVIVPKDVAKNLGNLHIVIHGADLPGDADASSAEQPVRSNFCPSPAARSTRPPADAGGIPSRALLVPHPRRGVGHLRMPRNFSDRSGRPAPRASRWRASVRRRRRVGRRGSPCRPAPRTAP